MVLLRAVGPLSKKLVDKFRIIGPLRFVITISNLPSLCRFSERFLFSDDAILLLAKPSGLRYGLARFEFNRLSHWGNVNRLAVTVQKSQVVSKVHGMCSPIIMDKVFRHLLKYLFGNTF